METSLHRSLKELYAGSAAQTEVAVGRYRIDAVVGDELIEVQHASLASIRDKVRRLLATHRVRVVKPIVASKLLIVRSRRSEKVLRRRKSPKRGTWVDLFHELVYFTKVFPHERLAIEAVLVDVEEWRRVVPPRGKRGKKFAVEDQRLAATHESIRIQSPQDLHRLLPADLPRPFHTGQLAEGMEIERWIAQRVAYTLRETGAVRTVGKERGAWLYELITSEAHRDDGPTPRGAARNSRRTA
jgi:hypothetical protein